MGRSYDSCKVDSYVDCTIDIIHGTPCIISMTVLYEYLDIDLNYNNS